MENENFAHWAVIEVFGHEKYAGHVTTEQIGGHSMVKLTVPAIEENSIKLPGFVKYINHTSVFSITPVNEEYATAMAVRLKKHPVQGYEHRQIVTEMAQRAVNDMKLDEIKRLLESGRIATAEARKSPRLDDNDYSVF